MLNARNEFQDLRLFKATGLGIAVVGLAWALSSLILSGDSTDLYYGIAVAVSVAVLLIVLKNWSHGIYIFFTWLVFEDLIRNYAGNSTYMFFAKDVLIVVVYVSMLAALRRRQLLTFRPPFLIWLSLFFWFCLLQILNPNSPTIFYGLLGLKTYFLYMPLMFAGYALLRSEDDLYKILILDLYIAAIVTGLGIAQAIIGPTLLQPTEVAPELRALGQDVRYTPLTRLRIERGTSVYVSEGRYAQALVIFFILALGTAGYFLLKRTERGRKIAFPILGLVVVAAVLAGIRGSIVAIAGSAVVMMVGMIWGAPPQKYQAFRIGKAIRLALTFATLSITLMVFLYPEVIRSRWAYYVETLSPTSASSELGVRSWQYPLANMRNAVSQGHIAFGHGTGTASIGAQYVMRLTGIPPLRIGAESGYGVLILEFGVIGLVLWIFWTLALLLYGWRVVRTLKRTRFFPIAFAFLWFAAYILVIGFVYGATQYENYLPNAYLWLTVGLLFRVPHLLREKQTPAPVSHETAAA